MSTYTTKRRLQPNVKCEILEHNDAGNLIGTWFGYWNFKRQTVTLYPDRTHPFFTWGRVPSPKVISDREVRVRPPEEAKKPAAKKESEYYSAYAIKRMPVPGQIKMKF